MAEGIKDVYISSPKLTRPVCMLGHTEGLIAWGRSAEEVLGIFTSVLDRLGS